MEPARPACYAWAGLNLAVVAAPPVINAAMQGMFELSRVDVPPLRWHAAVRMTVDEDDDFFNAMPELVRTHYEEAPTTKIPVVIRRDADEYAIIARGQETGSYVLCRSPYKEFHICSQVLADRSGELLFNAVLMPLVCDLLLNQGKVLMHAACLSTPGGEGLIFIADSGGGKTTTALSLFREGFHFVSDDLIVLFCQAGRIRVEGVPKTINLSPKTIGFFPELSSVRKTIGKLQAGKAPVAPVDLCGSEGLCRTALASSVIVVRLGPKGPRLIPRRATEILGTLMKSHTLATGAPISKQSLDVFWPLLEQARTYELVTGFDPIVMAERLAREAARGRFGAAVRLGKRQLLPNIARPPRILPRHPKMRLNSATTQKLLNSILGFSLDNRRVDPQTVRPLNNPRVLAGLWELMAYHRLDNHLVKFLVHSDMAEDLSAPFEPAGLLEEALATWRTLSEAAARVCRILGEGGIDVIFLRGPVFAKRYFREPWLRQCRDVDVAVRQSDLARAEKSLIDSGYQRVGERGKWLALGELPFRKDGVTIELHWSPYPLCASRRLEDAELERCWESRCSVQFSDGGGPVTVSYLEPGHLLFSSCLHCVHEHYLDRLVRLVDIRQILRAEADRIDWDWIAAQTFGGSYTLAVGHSLYCAHVLVKAPVPLEILKRFRPRGIVPRLSTVALPPRAILAGPSASRWRRALFRRLLRVSSAK